MAVDVDRLRRALAGLYAVERSVGAGGGAVVFRAEDLKHHRAVALKVLHPEVAAGVGSARFLREIEMAARLNHPHILPLHDSGEADSFLYYVMPYVDGESLRELLKREKQLPLDAAMQFAAEVGEALEYAHGQGIVHRDIKPENILISQGHALVADFGIATAIGAASTQRLTTATTVLGTPRYMSPEQWSGPDARVDGRSDIYSLGCVVYEMLGGQPPFSGPTAESIAYQHLSLEPRLVTALRPAVPGPVARAIHHALAKVAADRPASVAGFVAELRQACAATGDGGRRARPSHAIAAWAAIGLIAATAALMWWSHGRPAAGEPLHSIAVLPLHDVSGDSGQGYFVEGMTDELITCLAKISSLTVISNSATSTYRNSNKPLARIARELGVRFVLEGSVARTLGRVRISSRLIEANTGRTLWADSYERAFRDILALQSDVALAVAQQIRVHLTTGERATISAPRAIDPEAHDLYLKARFAIDPSTREGAAHSIQLLKQALELDPNYALAYAGLANTYYFMSGWYLPSRQALPLAEHYATQALALDSTLAEGLTVHGLVTYFYDWKFDEGLRLLRKAVEHNSGSALARQWYAYTLDAAGQFAEARAEFAHARQLDPVSEQLHWFATWPWYYERRYDRAIEALNQIRAEDAGYWPTYLLLGESYEALGNLPRALELLQKARDLGGNPWVVASIARVQAEAGRPEDARRIFRELVSGRDTAYVQAYALATVQARLGERDRAFELLEESFRDRTEDMCMLRIDPRVDPLRSDPRFASLMRRVGLR